MILSPSLFGKEGPIISTCITRDKETPLKLKESMLLIISSANGASIASPVEPPFRNFFLPNLKRSSEKS